MRVTAEERAGKFVALGIDVPATAAACPNFPKVRPDENKRAKTPFY